MLGDCCYELFCSLHIGYLQFHEPRGGNRKFNGRDAKALVLLRSPRKTKAPLYFVISIGTKIGNFRDMHFFELWKGWQHTNDLMPELAGQTAGMHSNSL